jgi:hypothetical protein
MADISILDRGPIIEGRECDLYRFADGNRMHGIARYPGQPRQQCLGFGLEGRSGGGA